MRFRWLFRLLSGRVAYENGAVAWQMRIAWKKYGSVDEDGSQDEDKGVEKIQTPENRKADEPRETTSRERQRQEEAP